MMVRPDIIVSWPKGMDYPVFRWNLKRFGGFIGNTIVTFTGQDKEENYDKWLKEANVCDFNAIFVDPPDESGDWRNIAVTEALQFVRSDWILFTEQDFLISEPSFFLKVFDRQSDDEVVVLNEEGRIHPAFILVSKRILDQTKKDFSIRPDVSDHFSKFTDELKKIAKMITLEDLGLKRGVDYQHLAGLTHNYTLVKINQLQSIFKKYEFMVYNYFSRFVPVKQHPRYVNLSEIAQESIMRSDPMYRFFLL